MNGTKRLLYTKSEFRTLYVAFWICLFSQSVFTPVRTLGHDIENANNEGKSYQKYLSNFENTLFNRVRRQTAGWTLQELPNPRTDAIRCGRSSPSWVCDPGGVLSTEEVDRMDRLIDGILHDSLCPCPTACPSSVSGYSIAVAIVPKMNVPRGFSASTEAKNWASQLVRTKWNFGSCDNDVVIVWSKEDKQLYSSAGPRAYKKLTTDCVGDIYSEAKPLFDGGSYAKGFDHIIKEYRKALLGERCSALPWWIILLIILAIFLLILLIVSLLLCLLCCKKKKRERVQKRTLVRQTAPDGRTTTVEYVSPVMSRPPSRVTSTPVPFYSHTMPISDKHKSRKNGHAGPHKNSPVVYERGYGNVAYRDSSLGSPRSERATIYHISDGAEPVRNSAPSRSGSFSDYGGGYSTYHSGDRRTDDRRHYGSHGNLYYPRHHDNSPHRDMRL